MSSIRLAKHTDGVARVVRTFGRYAEENSWRDGTWLISSLRLTSQYREP